MDLATRFGRLIRNERKLQRLSQQELADKAGCTKTYIVRLERAQNPNMQMKKALDVARTLGIAPRRLGLLLLEP